MIALIVALVEPRGTPAAVALLALPATISVALSGRLTRPFPLPPVGVVAALFAAYLAINASWSAEPIEAYGKVALFVVFAAAIHVLATALPALDDETVRRLGWSLLAAVGIGAAFLAVESAFGQPIKRAVASALPFLRPPPKHMVVEGDRVTYIGHYLLNRNIAVLGLLLWPGLLLASALPRRTSGRLAAAGLLLATAVAVSRSEHETSMIALVAACLVFAGMVVVPRLLRWLVVAAWVAATLLVVPLASSAYSAKLYQAHWMPKTARNRIVLWGVTAAKVHEAPVLGVGLGSTKSLDQDAADEAAWPKDHPYPLRTGRHSHNIYMQTWYELGALGAALLLAFGIAIEQALWRLAPVVRPYAYASFVTAAVISAFSWGMWQPWFMAAFGAWAAALLIADRASRSGGEKAAAI